MEPVVKIMSEAEYTIALSRGEINEPTLQTEVYSLLHPATDRQIRASALSWGASRARLVPCRTSRQPAPLRV